jgi:hypothetical protein
MCGVIFDPSGTRMYFSSQRSFGGPGAVFEVTGPFRQTRPPATAPVGGTLRLRAHAGHLSNIEKFRRGGGMAIEITSNRSVRAKVTIVARIGGREVTLARSYADLTGGKPQRVRLNPTSAARERLRGRTNVPATITVSAKHAATGSSDVLKRDVRFVKPKPR